MRSSSILVLLALAGSAHADPDPRSATEAIALSAGATGVSALALYAGFEDHPYVGLAGAVGAFVGPTIGHWYAGETLTPGFGLRVLGLGLAGIGLASTLGQPGDSSRLEAGFLYGGVAVFAFGAIYDVATAGKAADRWNRAHADRTRATILPTAMRAANGVAPGLALAGSF